MPNLHPQASRAAIEELIQQRLLPNADISAIDARMWQLFGEQWAILYTDLVGFSRKVESFGIVHFLQIIYQSRQMFEPIAAQFGGQILKEEGDSFLMIFRDPVAALQAALAMHHASEKFSLGKREEDRVELCVGLGWGRVLKIDDVDVFGSEVNSACKLGEDRAKKGETLATDAFAQAVKGKGDWECIAMNIQPVAAKQVYQIRQHNYGQRGMS